MIRQRFSEEAFSAIEDAILEVHPHLCRMGSLIDAYHYNHTIGDRFSVMDRLEEAASGQGKSIQDCARALADNPEHLGCQCGRFDKIEGVVIDTDDYQTVIPQWKWIVLALDIPEPFRHWLSERSFMDSDHDAQMLEIAEAVGIGERIRYLAQKSKNPFG